jgi:cytochrome c peroxidase
VSRRGRWIVAAVLCGATTGAGAPGSATGRGDLDSARLVYAAQLDTLRLSLEALSVTSGTDTVAVRAAFTRARSAYKHAEWWLAYSAPPVAAALNAQDIEGGNDEADDSDDSAEVAAAGVQFADPVGFQAVELRLYPTVLPGATAPVGAMLSAVDRLRVSTFGTSWTREAILEAARQELARVEAIGLANGDSRLAHAGLHESAAALDGLQRVVALVSAPSLDSALGAAALALRSANDTTFDRLRFLSREASGVARALQRPSGEAFWRTASLFDSAAFDVWAFAPADAPPPTPSEIALGQSLFNDPRLGGRSGHACVTCHQPARAFTDGQPTHPTRNTPTLINAALEHDLFADLRAPTLEAQVADVIANPREMSGLPIDSIAARVQIPAKSIQRALAAYVRTLVRLDSRFDRAVRGDSTALSPTERRGFTVFMGKGQCGFCHMLPLFNGMAPPNFDRSEVEVLGVPRTADTMHAAPDIDPGRYAISHDGRDLHAFRVPSLRNVAATAPYMHNGVYRTLDQVIDFYNRGGGEGIGARLANQTLSVRRLDLSAADRRALIAFLGALTDTSGTTATTSRTPAPSPAPAPSGHH